MAVPNVYSKEQGTNHKRKGTFKPTRKECIGRYAASLKKAKQGHGCGKRQHSHDSITKERRHCHYKRCNKQYLLADYGENSASGGQVKTETSAVVGVLLAQNQLREYFFKKAFLGMNGVDFKLWIYDPEPKRKQRLKKIAISKSNQAYVLADSGANCQSKFRKVAEFHQVTMVTNTTKEQATYVTVWQEAFVLLK